MKGMKIKTNSFWHLEELNGYKTSNPDYSR